MVENRAEFSVACKGCTYLLEGFFCRHPKYLKKEYRPKDGSFEKIIYAQPIEEANMLGDCSLRIQKVSLIKRIKRVLGW